LEDDMRLGLLMVVVLSVACSKTGDDPSGAGGTSGLGGTRTTTGLAGSTGTVSLDGGPGILDAPWIDPDASSPSLPADLRSQLDTAATVWAGTKASCPVYSYDRVWSSSFTGQYRDTYVEVTNDAATRVHIVSDSRPPRGQPDAGSEVDLRGDQITNGASQTVEGMLAECAQVLTVDQTQTTIRLVLSTQGVPIVCTATPKNCADDCTSGITLAAFVCAPLTAEGTIVN
jgi:hypothetical protein